MKLVADANVLLSSVLGGRARAILDHPEVEEVLTAAATLAEVEEYAAPLARRRNLPLDLILMAAASLPVTVVDPAIYKTSLPEARRRIGPRDPDDVEILALALHFRIPVWSNDNDFAAPGVPCYTTAELLALLVP